MKRLGIILTLTTLLNSSRQDNGCVIDFDPDSNNMVVPAFYNSNTLELLYPSPPDDDTVRIPKGDTVIVSCLGGVFNSTFYATCNENSQLEFQGKILDQFQNKCYTGDPVRTRNIGTCGDSSVLVEVELPLGLDSRLVPSNLICFDTSAKIPVYTAFNLTKSKVHLKNYLLYSDYFADDTYYDMSRESIENFYDLKQQMKNINYLLGLPEYSTKYISPDSCKVPRVDSGSCLEKLQLSDRRFFVTMLEQYASFRYINTAPVWSSIAGNSWSWFEGRIIDYIKLYNIDLRIYTGTYGVTTLFNENTGEDVELYLNPSENTFPVSRFIWRVLYDPKEYRAVVFITVNNPYQFKEEEVLCQDISNRYELFKSDKTNVTEGYSYICTYQEALPKIPVIPYLEVLDILL